MFPDPYSNIFIRIIVTTWKLHKLKNCGQKMPTPEGSDLLPKSTLEGATHRTAGSLLSELALERGSSFVDKFA